ncbi:MAG: Gfo/Idh/MocA family protein, partial [Gaiellaceae bacterium]
MAAALRIGIVGAGWIADKHLETLAGLDGVEVVAVADLDEERARKAAASSGANAYGGTEELLERERLDALFVCVPPLAHREAVELALDRGVHVYLEKPVARTVDDADAIVAAVERSGLVCAVGYQWHGLELIEIVRQELEGQTIGLLSGRSIGPTMSRPWFLDQAQGGGNVLERGSHHIDLQRTLGGEVTSVRAAASSVPLGQAEGEAGNIADALALELHFASGALGSIQLAWTRGGLPGSYGLDIVATEATIYLSLDPDFALRGVSRGRELAATAQQHPSERTVQRFLEAVCAGDPGLVFCT